MYCVTSVVFHALQEALLYFLDDSKPRHLLANRRFFEAQLECFCRPEYGIQEAAQIRYIQSPAYR